MNTNVRVLFCICAGISLIASVTAAKKPTNNNSYANRIPHFEASASARIIPDRGGEYPARIPPATAANSTTYLAYYSFDSGVNCTTEGWTSHDLTEQPGDFWHVTDFATGGEACGPGTFGRLVTLEGNQSLWCGACPDAGSEVLCGYAVLPGYGNGWNQAFCTTACLSVDSNVVVDYLVAWDAEPGYDATTVEVDNCDGNWVEVYGGVGVYDGVGSGFQSIAVPNDEHSGQLRIRFHFESDGAWSDEDDLYDSDGAFIVDSLSVSDAGGVVLAVEDFEDESVGDIDADDWESCTPPGYDDGILAGELRRGIQNLQEDPCATNATCMWDFYKNSTWYYHCNQPIPAPGQRVIPYVNARDQWIWNEIWSPEIPWTGSGTVADLSFDVYRDLKLDALVFYVWHIRPKVSGCPTGWPDRGFVYYGDNKDWLRGIQPFADLVPPGTTHIQVSLGVIDMCPFWCGVYYYVPCHSHAPLFDNVEIYRVALEGPQFAWRDIDQFQDTFSSDGTITGTARIDMAMDILPYSNPGILPGDSAVVGVNDPEVGLAGDAYTGTGPAVYCYVGVHPQGQPSKTGASIQAPDTRALVGLRWPHVGDVVIGGDTWHQFRMDTCFASSGGVIPDKYCIDLNDDLFTPGDTLFFFYGAQNASAVTRYYAGGYGWAGSAAETAENADECTILPSGFLTDILYVDGMNFRGAQWAFDTSFERMDLGNWVDRFDIRGPSSGVGNHLGSRVVDANAQLAQVYRQLLWNCGDLRTAFGDGSGTPDKSDDTGVLKVFLDNLPNWAGALPSGGVYLDGDDVADVWDRFSSASALALRFYLSYTVTNTDHVAAGAGVSPWVVGTGYIPPSDTIVAYGGCPQINDFDVLGSAGSSQVIANYVNALSGTPVGGAIVMQQTVNPGGAIISFVLSGFSFHFVRDYDADGIADRWEHLNRIFGCLGDSYGPITGTRASARVNSLAQNYPNPFNPATTIAYAIKEPGHVSLKVYNVAGQLVKTLVDETQRPEAVVPVPWDGRNNAGQPVSSGVYFYKLVTKGFTQTKKMVLLK